MKSTIPFGHLASVLGISQHRLLAHLAVRDIKDGRVPRDEIKYVSEENALEIAKRSVPVKEYEAVCQEIRRQCSMDSSVCLEPDSDVDPDALWTAWRTTPRLVHVRLVSPDGVVTRVPDLPESSIAALGALYPLYTIQTIAAD